MQQKAQFTKSKVGNLIRHRAGGYYAVAKVAGKTVRRSLDTTDFNTAKARLDAALTEIRGASKAKHAGTLREALTAEAERQAADIKPTTRSYYQQVAKAMIAVSDRGHPGQGIADKAITKATLADLRQWLDEYAAGTSATRYNGALALLRRTYERAIESQHIVRNLPRDLKRVQPKIAKRELPTVAEFQQVVASILEQRKRSSKATAAAVRFLAATGLRISEAQSLRWKDIDENALIVRTAKNDSLRRLPLTKTAKEVLADFRAVRPCKPDDAVLPIKSPRIALEAACERLGFAHLRVHDLRHIFATRCIEANVDIPTIAGWLGHKDGGALAAKVYGHLLDSHSAKQIQRVEI